MQKILIIGYVRDRNFSRALLIIVLRATIGSAVRRSDLESVKPSTRAVSSVG